MNEVQTGTSEITKACVLLALRAVLDPELGVNIVDLGLVYAVEICGAAVRVTMTMTTPACPLHSYLNEAAKEAIRGTIPAAESVEINLVWEPPWQPAMMSDEAKRQLGWRG